MVSEKKKQLLKEIEEEIEKYPVVGVLDLFKFPARQLQEIREKLRGKAKIKMVKKRIIKLALKEVKKEGLEELEKYVQGEAALLFSEIDPFKLGKIIEESKTFTKVKEGDVFPKDIVIPEGPTSLPPGPVIGELQKMKIPASIQENKIVVKKDTVVAKEGDTASKELADILNKLGIEPIELKLNLLAVWNNGIIFTKDVLFIPKEEYINKLELAHVQAFNLSLNIGYYTKETIPILISKAYMEALNLASSADIVTKDTIKILLQKAYSQANILKTKIKEG